MHNYNTAVHDSTKYTPFEVMFGRKERLPIEFNTNNCYRPEDLVQDYEDIDEEVVTDRQTQGMQ